MKIVSNTTHRLLVRKYSADDVAGAYAKALVNIRTGWWGSPEPVSPPPPKDAPNFGGWSAGDVEAYLSRFGHVTKPDDRRWVVCQGYLFRAEVYFTMSKPAWMVELCDSEGMVMHLIEDQDDIACFWGHQLPTAMQGAIEYWRDVVIPDSDPCRDSDGTYWDAPHTDLPETRRPTPTRHIGTGDMGTRTTWAGGFGGRDE